MYSKCSIDGTVDDCIVMFVQGEKSFHVAFCKGCWNRMSNIQYRTELIKLISMIAQKIDQLGVDVKDESF